MMPQTKRLTPQQRAALEHAIRSPFGVVVDVHTYKGFGSRSRRLMFHRMKHAGLVRDYVHGGYEITDAGREAYRVNAYVVADASHVRQGE